MAHPVRRSLILTITVQLANKTSNDRKISTVNVQIHHSFCTHTHLPTLMTKKSWRVASAAISVLLSSMDAAEESVVGSDALASLVGVSHGVPPPEVSTLPGVVALTAAIVVLAASGVRGAHASGVDDGCGAGKFEIACSRNCLTCRSSSGTAKYIASGSLIYKTNETMLHATLAMLCANKQNVNQ